MSFQTPQDSYHSFPGDDPVRLRPGRDAGLSEGREQIAGRNPCARWDGHVGNLLSGLDCVVRLRAERGIGELAVDPDNKLSVP